MKAKLSLTNRLKDVLTKKLFKIYSKNGKKLYDVRQNLKPTEIGLRVGVVDGLTIEVDAHRSVEVAVERHLVLVGAEKIPKKQLQKRSK